MLLQLVHILDFLPENLLVIDWIKVCTIWRPYSDSGMMPGPTFSKHLRKMLGRFLILGQSLTISGEKLPDIISLYWYLLINDLTTMSRNNVQHDIIT